jgi:hypothetical protein
LLRGRCCIWGAATAYQRPLARHSCHLVIAPAEVQVERTFLVDLVSLITCISNISRISSLVTLGFCSLSSKPRCPHGVR